MERDRSAESNLVIVQGPPGAGKGTQSKMFVSRNPASEALSLGDIIRDIYNNSSASIHSEFIQNRYFPHQLMPDSMANDILFENITSRSSLENILIDGYPRAKMSLELLEKSAASNRIRILGCVCLGVSVDTSVHRMASRGLRVGETTKGIGSEREYYTHRYNEYMERHHDIINTLANRMTVVDVDANHSIQNVYERFSDAISSLKEQN